MNVNATLVFSQGHHPANHRSAVPARAYESGSGHGHDAAPAGHPHPPRPPPRTGSPRSPGRPHHPRAAAPPQGRLRRRPASAPRPLTRTGRPRNRQPSGLRAACPATDQNPIQNTTNHYSQAEELQSLDTTASYECATVRPWFWLTAWRRSWGIGSAAVGGVRPGLDLDRSVAAGGLDELSDRPVGPLLDRAAGGQVGGEDDRQVGFDGVPSAPRRS
jgi:hypothetical protein